MRDREVDFNADLICVVCPLLLMLLFIGCAPRGTLMMRLKRMRERRCDSFPKAWVIQREATERKGTNGKIQILKRIDWKECELFLCLPWNDAQRRIWRRERDDGIIVPLHVELSLLTRKTKRCGRVFRAVFTQLYWREIWILRGNLDTNI